MVDVGRDRLDQRPQHAPQPLERADELGIVARVGGREEADRRGGALDVPVQDDRRAARGRRERAHVGRDPAQPALLEAQLARDARAERTGVVRERDEAEAILGGFGDGRAADHGAALEHHALDPGARQIARGDETVVPGADDDHLARSHESFPAFQSCRTMRAPLRPGAPMIPPPGCVADPHM